MILTICEVVSMWQLMMIDVREISSCGMIVKVALMMAVIGGVDDV